MSCPICNAYAARDAVAHPVFLWAWRCQWCEREQPRWPDWVAARFGMPVERVQAALGHQVMARDPRKSTVERGGHVLLG